MPTKHQSDQALPLRWSWVVTATALAAAVLVASQTYLSMLHHGHSWWRLLAWQLICWGFWAAMAPVLIRQGARSVGADVGGAVESRRRWWIGNLLLTAAMVPTQLVIAALATYAIQPFRPVEQMSLRRAFDYMLAPWFLIGILVAGLLLTAGYGLAAMRHNRDLVLRESRLETELAKAQLEALRLEIQPHFLFNTLNSIAALVRRRHNDEALEMLLGLSHLLRLTLDRGHDQLVELAAEIDFVRRYAELQQQRFADRLTVTFEVDEHCLQQAVPSLLLQPLVENAIRHGIAKRTTGGTVAVRARCRDATLEICVRDDGAGLPAGFDLERDHGVGLGNLRTRLRHLYGSQECLQLSPLSPRGTEVRLSLPLAAQQPTGLKPGASADARAQGF